MTVDTSTSVQLIEAALDSLQEARRLLRAAQAECLVSLADKLIQDAQDDVLLAKLFEE